MTRVVLDASALIALINAEPGADLVAQNLTTSVISAVNLAEVVAKLCSRGMPENEIRGNLESLGLEVVPFEEIQAYQCGWLYTATNKMGLSLGDRACLSLAKLRGLPALTADKSWTSIPGAIVTLIR